MNIMLTAVLATLAVFFFGGGLGYLIWIKSRPKKQTWPAKIYQLMDAIIPQAKDGDGNFVAGTKLKGMIPYGIDTVEKVEKANQQTIYRLQKLKKTVPAPEAGTVELWGVDKKEVSVLLQKSGCTLLKKGYDYKTGQLVFQPLPYGRVNMIKHEIIERQNRLNTEKDILQAIAPWIVTGIVMVALVALAYVNITGIVKMSERLDGTNRFQAEKTVELEELRRGIVTEEHPLGIQEQNPINQTT